MTRSIEAATQAEKIAELKRIITTGTFETLEKLEDAVDAFLWAEEDEEVASSDDPPFDPSSLAHDSQLTLKRD